MNPLVDRLLRLRRADRTVVLESIAAALERFPALDRFDRRVLLRRLAINDGRNRLIFRFITRFPAVAALVAAVIPIVGNVGHITNAKKGQPILLAFMHFGPAHFVIAIAMRLLRGRRVYVFHAGGLTGRASARYLGSTGAIPVLTDREALKKVSAEMAADPHCAVFVFFDHLNGRGRQSISFLGSEMRVPTGVAFLAREHRATAITGWWEWKPFPRVRIGKLYEVDANLEPSKAESDLIVRLFRDLEERVAVVPQEWTEWSNCFGSETG